MDLLDDGGGMLIAEGSGDAKSSTDAIGAARRYSVSIGGVDLCQVAVHLIFAMSAEHCLIDRRLYFTKEWVGDGESRLSTGVPEELCLATRPQLEAVMVHHAVGEGDIRASFFLGDEVYGGREFRTACHELDPGYVVGVPFPSLGRRSGREAERGRLAVRLRRPAWPRMRAGAGLKGVHDCWCSLPEKLHAREGAVRQRVEELEAEAVELAGEVVPAVADMPRDLLRGMQYRAHTS